MRIPATARCYPKNFVEHLRRLAEDRSGDLALTVVAERDGQVVDTPISYAALDVRVRALAAHLQERFAAGERALLLLDNDDHYAVAFLACAYAGLIAVPVFPPESMRPQHLARLAGIAQDAQARAVLTTSGIQAAMGAVLDAFPGVTCLAVDTVGAEGAHAWRAHEPTDSDIAFLQYTSGSTAKPKGVMVSHGNLMANERVMEQTLGLHADDVFASWLPLYHDMGLIGGLLQPIHRGAPLVLMTPRFFLERPQRWLEAVTRHRATVTGGPDFAFRLCLERIKEAQLEALDLSSWRIAYTGAEPVRHDTLREFGERFAPAGFDATAFQPCYGLAEATLFITGGRASKEVVARGFSPEALGRGLALQTSEGAVLIGCGQTAQEHVVRITDPANRAVLPDGQVGEIWACGPSIARGYWENVAATQEALVAHAGQTWLRTGDLGFMLDGQLFVTGRIKDLIIVRGHNLYPQDIERAIEREVEAVRPGRVSAFAVNGPDGEGIGVAAEVSRGMQKIARPQALVEALSTAVSELCGQPLSVVALLQPGVLPKTSSGKLQRQAARKGVAERSLDAYAIWDNGRFVVGGEDVASAVAAEPADEIERELATIWRDVLQLDLGAPVGREAHFFVLGGNSLAAVQAVARIGERWGVEFSVRTLFEQPRLAESANAVRLALSEGRVRASIPVIPEPHRAQPQPLSHAQGRQWFLWRLDPSSTAYHVSAAVTLSGALDIEALRGAIRVLVGRHEALRTVFGPGADDTGEQRVLPSLELDVSFVDVSDSAAAQRATRADGLAAEMNGQPFDLTTGPLVRACIIRLQPSEHRLVVVMHHIVSDAVSVQIFFDELGEAYAAQMQRRAPSFGALPIQYVDYGAWHREWLATDELARQLAYWRSALGSDHPVLDLPTDRPRAPEARYQAASVKVDLPDSLVAELRRAAKAQGLTVATVLLAAFQALLYRYTGQEDVRVGVPSANRHSPGTGAVIGFFVNTLVLRNAFDGRKTLAQVLNQAREAMQGAQAHPDVPFEHLVEVLHPQRSLAHAPLFQVLFNHLVEDFGLFEKRSGLGARRESVAGQAAQFELALDSTERADGGIGVVFTYGNELFEVTTISRMVEHYLSLLQALCATPDLPVGDVAFQSDAERFELTRWMAGPQEQGDGVPVHRSIERQAALRPDAIAVEFGGEVLSYAALNAQANRLAHHLIARGVRQDIVVGVALERSIDLVVALLAVLKAGGAYLPLDLEYPQDRLVYMLSDSGAGVLLTARALESRLSEAGAVLRILLDEVDLRTEPEINPSVDVDGDQLGYVIYTSGSTGRPKGAGNRHRSLCNRLAWMQSAYGLGSDDAVLQKTPYGFDVSVWEFFWPLTVGARLVVARPGDHRDPERLVNLIRTHGVTTIHFVPSMLQVFLVHPDIEACTSLKRIVCSGEALPAEVQATVFARFPHAVLYNLYGPTEAAIDVTHWTCKDDGKVRVPIGQPIAGVHVGVLDADLGVVPRGVVGELYLGGVGLARGYLNRPGLTAERFVADPLGAPGGRLYRTGDLVRWNVDGYLEYQGRCDHQVKIRGLRVELGEIEAELLLQPEVREAAVIVDQRHGETRLAGYVSLHDGLSLAAETLRQRLAKALPDYMVPGFITVLEKLPLSVNGKLDRKALPVPEWSSSRPFEAPKGELAKALAQIWAEVLHRQPEQIGLNDNFFDLGGHSLAMVRAHRLICDSLRSTTSLIDLFRYPTIAALVAHIEAEVSPEQNPGHENAERALRRRDALLRRRQTIQGGI